MSQPAGVQVLPDESHPLQATDVENDDKILINAFISFLFN